ncbi:MAG: DUF2333 family protein [Alphaproteobacteria bacterium]|nr:DUF2333 family protein [Alphaproteobacteria bacterium]
MTMVTDRLMGQARRLLPDMSGSRVRAASGLGIAVVVAALLYYPIGMLITHRIDDDADYQTPAALVQEEGSRAVAIAAALIEREVDENRWVANDPFFLPPAALDNMPNYQQGIISALARFAFELTDQIGRTRGTSQTDKDLQEAAGQLQYAGDVWVFDLSTSFAPTTTSEARYRKAARSLKSYNRRLADGKAVFERRADNLLATLDRFALDMGSSSANLDRHIAEHAGDLIDTRADDVFYGIKGQSYAYYLIIRELGLDYGNVLGERELGNAWAKMLESLRLTAELSPTVVVNGSPDAQAMPSHLAAQGFYLLRARTKLREITNILLK